jgi:hypothetical protein
MEGPGAPGGPPSRGTRESRGCGPAPTAVRGPRGVPAAGVSSAGSVAASSGAPGGGEGCPRVTAPGVTAGAARAPGAEGVGASVTLSTARGGSRPSSTTGGAASLGRSTGGAEGARAAEGTSGAAGEGLAAGAPAGAGSAGGATSAGGRCLRASGGGVSALQAGYSVRGGWGGGVCLAGRFSAHAGGGPGYLPVVHPDEHLVDTQGQGLPRSQGVTVCAGPPRAQCHLTGGHSGSVEQPPDLHPGAVRAPGAAEPRRHLAPPGGKPPGRGQCLTLVANCAADDGLPPRICRGRRKSRCAQDHHQRHAQPPDHAFTTLEAGPAQILPVHAVPLNGYPSCSSSTDQPLSCDQLTPREVPDSRRRLLADRAEIGAPLRLHDPENHPVTALPPAGFPLPPVHVKGPLEAAFLPRAGAVV